MDSPSNNPSDPADQNTSKPQTDATDPVARRKARRERLAQANRVTVELASPVRKYLAAEARNAGVDLSGYLSRIAERFIIETAPEENPLARQLKARHVVCDRIDAIAVQIDEEGGFDEHFIRSVMQRAATDVGFVAQYRAALGPETMDDVAQEKARPPMNQQLVRMIKRAAGARSLRDAEGKITRADDADSEMMPRYMLVEKIPPKSGD